MRVLLTATSRRCGARRLSHRRQLPEGFSLIELLFVIAVTTMLMVVCTKWMHQSMKFSSTVRVRTADHQTLDQLGRQFRMDVRNSQSMALAGDTLTLKTDSGALTYTIEGRTLVAKEPLTGTNVRTAQYRFHQGIEMRWDTDELPASIGLVVERKETRPTTLPESSSAPQSEPAVADNVETRSRIELFVKARPRQ